VPIVMLTARGTEFDKVIGLELGADDYVVKPFSSAELIARMRAILRRSAEPVEAHRGPVTIGELVIDERSRRATLGGREVDLTLKEFDLLARLVRDAGTVVRREDLMADVWDENWFGSMKTLDVHVSTLRRKLEDDPALPRYLHTVRGVGFRFASPEEFEG
jgi:DNA-binding response OmpR family regulator